MNALLAKLFRQTVCLCLCFVGLGLFVSRCGGPAGPGLVDVPAFETGATVVHTERGSALCNGPSLAGCREEDRSGQHCPNSKGPADIFVVAGKVVHAVCYGSPKSEVVLKRGDQKIEKHDTLVTFDPTQGEFVGKLEVKGDRSVIYGHGPTKTIIHGEVHLHGHDCRLRGVTVRGKLRLHGDRCSAVSVVVEGDAEVHGHDVLLSHLVVLGNLKIKDERLFALHVYLQGKAEIKKKVQMCVETYHFEDLNNSNTVEPGEMGRDWCGR